MHRPSARESWAWRPSTAVTMSARWGSLACGATKRPRACCSCPCGRPRRPARLVWTTGGCRRLAPLATTNAWSTSVLMKVTSNRSLGRPGAGRAPGVAWWRGPGTHRQHQDGRTWPLPMSRSLSVSPFSLWGLKRRLGKQCIFTGGRRRQGTNEQEWRTGDGNSPAVAPWPWPVGNSPNRTGHPGIGMGQAGLIVLDWSFSALRWFWFRFPQFKSDDFKR